LPMRRASVRGSAVAALTTGTHAVIKDARTISDNLRTLLDGGASSCEPGVAGRRPPSFRVGRTAYGLPLLFDRGEGVGEESGWINFFSSIGVARKSESIPHLDPLPLRKGEAKQETNAEIAHRLEAAATS
jgi:hypothetical protein